MHLVLVGESFDQTGIHDGVGRLELLPLIQHFNCLLNKPVANQRIHHATTGDLVGLDGTLVHHLPPQVPTGLDLFESTIGFDE
jgi:hypothetical protein